MNQDTFKGSLLGFSKNVSDTALSIVCTINGVLIAVGLMYLILMTGIIYKKQNQDE